ncbi:MAG TPA: PIG-L family deacetylase [Edaphobacter sp.]|jgi:LmbE family N-acetylglucosaminyl deacetylase|nr:PIG-L family deacetylase [Edaphobacter sp.]
MKIVLLSPHRDDAAFSLSLAITNWLAAGHTVTLLNVFTRSLHAPFSDADFVHENDRLSYVSAMRLREDELFLQRLTDSLPRAAKSRIQLADLNLKDAPIRLRCPLEELSDTPVNPEDPAIEKIRKALARHAEAGTMQALVLPLALGHHVDHLTVREAALPLTTTLPSAFYEDLPYAATYPSAAVDLLALRDEAATRFAEPLSPIVYCAPDGASLKRHLSLGYASQIDDAAADLISDFATRYDGGERLWANASWLAAVSSV